MLNVAVLPEGLRPFLRDAVRDGGGTLVGLDDEPDALVWTNPRGGDELRALLAAHPSIRWVQLPWAGIEPFVDVLDREHIWTAGQGVYAVEVAEHALALALAGLRDLKVRARATSWERPSGLSLVGGRVTIVGGGGIARELVKLLAPFSVDVTVVRRKPEPFVLPDGRHARTLTLSSLHEAVRDADVVFLACALTPETRRCVDATVLASMKQSAWLVNVARGGIVDTQALVDALARGVIGGAALDVTDPEPLPDGHPLWSSPRCLITPHCANTPEMAVPVLTERVRENVRRKIAGEPLLGLVDVEHGY